MSKMNHPSLLINIGIYQPSALINHVSYYYWEVEVLSVSGPNSFNGTGLYVPCVNDSSALACDWLSTGGGYYRYSDGTQGQLLNWTSRAVDTNFTMLFTTVPEPVTLVMLGTGLLGILRRKV